MADLQHNALTTAQVHEPKGALEAAADTVYVADGLGSGSWALPPITFTNVIEVTSLSDLPAPVGGIITLEANTAYYISGTVNIAPNTIDASSTGVAILGFNRASDALVTDSTNALIRCTDNNLPLTAFTVSNTNASGTLFDFNNTGTNVIILDKIFFGQCASIGTINNFKNLIIDNCGISSATPIGGIVFTGSDWEEILVRDSLFQNWSGTLYDLNTAVSDYIEIIGTRFIGGAADIAVDGLASAGNIGILGTISTSLFNGMTSPTGNLDHADSGWFFSETIGIQESDFIGYASMVGNATATTGSGAAYTKVVGTTVAFADNERFTMSADSELTFNGLLPRPVSMLVNVSGNTGGGSDTVSVTIYKDSGGGYAQLDSNIVSQFTAAATPQSCALVANDTASPGDKYAVYVTNSSGAGDVTVENLQFSMRG